ncbi:helix-turn-helix domain-containing protein [Jatrophihabitans endophyticus]|uniref:winged helix-turn-helix transcriptional regulator n=1 Tax=Jatrophihabitans endophyticus TaxID=1206085 RepID=UPI001A0B95B1|nr:helix-turn-helix domain-containing protein [Jatrophihabitans endophyticus]MBE7190205.1 helix-turn-helix transcriptional regulator [Jatrophihabitans endophyticus]
MSSEFEPSGRRICPIADALDVVGDRWSLLIVRELSFGVTRFNDIRAHTGAPRATVAARLRDLEASGLVERHRYNEHPPRDEYRLTACGAELAPTLRALRRWGERHATQA